MKNRLLSIMDKSKKRKGAILICLALILTLCTSLVLAANTVAPENVTLYTADDTLQFDPEKDTNETVGIEGRISLAYTDDDGEAVLRVTDDGGATWYIQDENDNLTLDPDMSATEWLTYDEFRAWIDKQDATDEKITEYEAMLERFVNFNNGGADEDIIKAGIGMTAIRGVERPFLCTVSRSYYDYETGAIDDGELTVNENGTFSFYNGETWQTYSQEEIDELIAQDSMTDDSNVMVSEDGTFSFYSDKTWRTYSQEEIDELIAQAQDSITYDSEVTVSEDGFVYAIHRSETEGFVCTQRSTIMYEYFVSDVGGENLGACADTYKELYKIVKDFFEEKIQEGKMTREDADSRLAEMSEENTRTVIFFDEEGNIINN